MSAPPRWRRWRCCARWRRKGAKRRAAAIVVHVAGAVALYVLNHKRVRLAEIEARYAMSVAFAADESSAAAADAASSASGPKRASCRPTTYIPIAAQAPAEDDLAEEAEDEVEEQEERACRGQAGAGRRCGGCAGGGRDCRGGRDPAAASAAAAAGAASARTRPPVAGSPDRGGPPTSRR